MVSCVDRLVVSIAGWAIGVNLQPDSPVLLVHCQDCESFRCRAGSPDVDCSCI